MPRYMKEEKIYPGEWRIIAALHSKGPLTFTQLIAKAKINRVTLSEYLKHLKRRNIIEHDKATGRYSFPITFQPLLESSFPDEELLQLISQIIKMAQVAKRRWGARDVYLQLLLEAFNFELYLALTEASCYKDLSTGLEYLNRFSERHLIPRLQLLLIEASQDRAAFNELMKEPRRSLLQRIRKLTQKSVVRRVHARKRLVP